MIKVLRVERSDIDIKRIGKRDFVLSVDTWVKYYTDEGVYCFYLKAGFRFNGRSGGCLIDFFLPNLGDDDYNAVVAVHDACFDTHCCSFMLSNRLFRGGLIAIGRKPEKAQVAFRFVKSFLGKIIYWKKQDKVNMDKVELRIDAK